MSPRKPSSNKTMAPPECRAGLGSCFDQPWFAPSLIFVLALVLRLIYVSQTRGTPFFETLGLDARFYDQWARRLAAGEGYGEPFFMSPLYPYFLAGLYRLFGRDLFLVRVVQSVIGAGSAALTYLLARDLFDSRAGLIAGLVTACYGALIFYDGSVVMTPLLVFLNLLSLFLLARSERIGGVLFPMAAGFTLGLAAIGRAAALLFVPLAVAWIVWARGRAGTKSAPRPADARSGREGPREASGASASPATAGWRMAALYVLGILLVIAPITTRNYAVSGDFIPITSNGGLNFYIGNGDIATGGYAKPEGLDIVEDPGGELIAEAELGRDLTPSEISSYWYSRAWSHIGGDPGAWAGLLIRKLSFALGSYEFPQLENYEFQRRYSTLLSLPLPGFGVVAPLGLLGLGLAFRRRRGSLLGLFFIAYVMSIVVFFVLARYRLPAVPALAIGASHAAVVAYDRLRARAFRSVAWFAVALLALGFLVNANLYSVDRGTPFAQIHYRLGIIYGDRGEVNRALAEYGRAIEIDPDYPKSYLNMGALLADRGEFDEAETAFMTALDLDPAYLDARVNLAMVYLTQERYDDAVRELETALEQDPRSARALTQLGIAFYRMGREEEALEFLTKAEAADRQGSEVAEIHFYRAIVEGPTERTLPEEARRAIALADSLIQVGRAGEAVEALTEASVLAPDSGVPLQRLGILKRDMGLLDEAVSFVREALRIDPLVPHGHFTLGVMLNEAGRHDEAIRHYEAELRISPDFAAAHRNLATTSLYHLADRNRATLHYREYLRLGGERVPALDQALLPPTGGGR